VAHDLQLARAMNRRTFMTWGGTAVAAAALTRGFRGSARAAGFGEFPTAAQQFELPEGVRAKRVLEIFLYGGFSPWETLYLVRDYGAPGSAFPGTQFHAFNHATAISRCGFPTTDIGQFFAQDANTADVELGVYSARLWTRPDFTNRMRVVVNSHRLEPHEAAVPTALTGRSVGQPGAGLGAHIQRWNLDTRPSATRSTPHSYVFATGGLTSDNVESAASTGLHSGAAQPLFVKVDNASALFQSLGRATVGAKRTAHDNLSAHYLEQWNARLRPPGATAALRSNATAEYTVALDATRNVDAIADVLGGEVFAPRSATVCAQTGNDIPLISLEAARHLLTHPTEPASYVCVSDTGLFEAAGGGGYDTHGNHAFDTARNFDNVLRALLGIFNAPGETDPTKLNLDDTLVILNTEFGRTPRAEGDGRNHWPYGYATAFIGGPIGTAQKGIYGAIGEDGNATLAVDPAECRAGALLAMGIWPFSPEAFATSDVRGATTEADAAALALEHCLGRSV
jgi:hypothetical protein